MSAGLPYGERERCLKNGYNKWLKHRWVHDSRVKRDICANCGAQRSERGIVLHGKTPFSTAYAKHRRRDW